MTRERNDRSDGLAPPEPPMSRQAERETDLLVRLIGRRSMQTMDPEDPGNAAFWDWYARECRDRQSPTERRETATQARAFAERVLARHAAMRLAVGERRGEPTFVAALAVGALRDSIAAAGRMRCAPAVDLAVAAGAGRELWEEPCERWVELPPDIPEGEHIALTVAGDSMQPLLHAGDTILVRMGHEVMPNAIIVARHPDDGYVVKRVGRVSVERVELTSLNPAYRPVMIPRDETLVLGTVVMRWCAH